MKVARWKRFILRLIGLGGVGLVDQSMSVPAEVGMAVWVPVLTAYSTGDAQVDLAMARVVRWTESKLNDLRTGREEPW
jgi:hypothetical protein